MVLGEEFQIITGHVHKRFMFGLRNVNIQQALAERTMSLSSLAHKATVTGSSDDSLKGGTVSSGCEFSFRSVSFR